MGDPFTELLEVAQEQAKHASAMVELERTQSAKLDSMQSLLSTQTMTLSSVANSLASMDKARSSAVEEVKAHIELAMAKSERGWKFLVWLLGILVVAANVIGPTLAAYLFKR